MTLYRRNYALIVIATLMCGVTFLPLPAQSQDAAWEGFIEAGQRALQQENFGEAERQFESALEAAERFPSSDPRLGKSYNNLAAIYYAQEDYARAEPLMRRALEQLREALGHDNTEVAQTMKNLAALYYLQGNRVEAEGLLKQALATMETVHGPNHAYVATVLSNLAGLYQADNRYQEAEPLLVRSLEIWEGLLGPDHPDVTRSRALLVKVQEANADARGEPIQTGSQQLGTDQAAPGQEGSDSDAAESGIAELAALAPEVVKPGSPKPAALSNEAEDVETNESEASDNAPESDRPRALTALAAPEVATDDQTENKSEEIAEATLALERLSRSSKAEVDGAAAAFIPTPPVRAIDSGEPSPAEPEISEPSDEPTEPTPSTGGKIVATALAAPNPAENDDAPDATSSGPAAAILSKAKSSDDVSYAVYLSTLWSVEEAKRYWSALQAAMPGVLDDKQMEIEEVAAADGPDSFFRVLTSPFDSDPEAQETCEFIQRKLRTHDCEVVIRGNADG